MDETAVGQHAGVMSHLIITQYDKLRLCCSSLTFIFSGWGIETQMDEDWTRGAGSGGSSLILSHLFPFLPLRHHSLVRVAHLRHRRHRGG